MPRVTVSAVSSSSHSHRACSEKSADEEARASAAISEGADTFDGAAAFGACCATSTVVIAGGLHASRGEETVLDSLWRDQNPKVMRSRILVLSLLTQERK